MSDLIKPPIEKPLQPLNTLDMGEEELKYTMAEALENESLEFLTSCLWDISKDWRLGPSNRPIFKHLEGIKLMRYGLSNDNPKHSRLNTFLETLSEQIVMYGGYLSYLVNMDIKYTDNVIYVDFKRHERIKNAA